MPFLHIMQMAMSDDTYHTIAAPSQGLYKDKGSKFLAFAYPVHSEEQVKEHLDAIRKKYFDARHHCYAYAIGYDRATYRSNDDGEPSGTAGKPIYGQLLSADITNVLIVVVRYFGGILLGTSGLITAYRAAARDAINNAQIIEKTIDIAYRLRFGYDKMNDVMRILKDNGLSYENSDFGMSCQLDIRVRKSQSQKIYNALTNLQTVELQTC